MNLKSAAPVALAAAVFGAGGGAAVVALTGEDGGRTTTVVQQAPLASTSNTSTTSDGALTPREIYKRDAPGVVFIRAEVVQQTQSPFLDPAEQRGESTGSGFVIDDDGNIITNAHVVAGAVKVSVQFSDSRVVSARIIGKDVSTDIALLRVDPDGLDLKPLELGSAKQIQVGDPTIAIGNPFGLERTLTTGVVSALQRRIEAPNGFAIRDVIQTDAAINPGNSGGPLLDATGRVIGVNSQIATGGTSQGNVGIGFAVPVDTVKDVLAPLKSGKAPQRAQLGVVTATVDDSLEALNLPVDAGVLVQDVQQGTPADKAGLRGGNISAEVNGEEIQIGGDIITAVDGEKVLTADDLASAIQSREPGDTVKITYVRGGDEKTVEVELAKLPSSAAQG